VIGWSDGQLLRAQVVDESPLGNVIADAQLESTQAAAGAVAAFMNPGGIRADARILSVSARFTYTWDGAVPQATCDKVSNIAIGGVPVDPAASYRITVNSFLADGGDRFFVLREGTDRDGGALDLDAFEAQFAGTSQAAPLPTPALDRITRVN
jgi:5'-nucleotidase